MKTAIKVRIKTQIADAKTGRIVKDNPVVENLVFDTGLNALALSTSNSLGTVPANANKNCQVGSGTNANSFNNPAVTFTQALFVVTASAGFFTSNMVGGILKYGTGSGGAEYYITGFTSSTIVTVNTSATVAASQATVYMVQQTGLQTFLLQSALYQTNSGDCGSTILGSTITHKRTFIFPVQGSPYTVNEIGWSPMSNASFCLGRVVLPTSDNVGTSNIYIVVISLVMTYGPSAPAAVGNVGTGSINTAGNAMVEWFSVATVNSSGSTNQPSSASLDGGAQCRLAFASATYTQNSAIGSTPPAGVTSINVGTANWAYQAASIGIMNLSFLNGTITTTGQTVFGIYIDGVDFGRPDLDIKFTASQTLPNGAFNPQTVWTAQYVRQLSN